MSEASCCEVCGDRLAHDAVGKECRPCTTDREVSKADSGMTVEEARAALNKALSDASLRPLERLKKLTDIALELFCEERARQSKRDDGE